MIPSNVWRSPGTLGVFDYPPLFGTCDEPCDVSIQFEFTPTLTENLFTKIIFL